MTEMNLSMKQKQTHRHRDRMCGSNPGQDGDGVRGGMD